MWYLMNKYDSSVLLRAGGSLKKTILMYCGGGKKVEERGVHTFIFVIY